MFFLAKLAYSTCESYPKKKFVNASCFILHTSFKIIPRHEQRGEGRGGGVLDFF